MVVIFVCGRDCKRRSAERLAQSAQKAEGKRQMQADRMEGGFEDSSRIGVSREKSKMTKGLHPAPYRVHREIRT